MAIKSCTCTHTYQDAKYGKGKRVFNRTSGSTRAGGSTKAGYRCTVCGRMFFPDKPIEEVKHDA